MMFNLSVSNASTRKPHPRLIAKRAHSRRYRPTPEVLEGRQLLATLAGDRPLPAFEASATVAGTRTWTPRIADLQVDQGQTNWLRVAGATTNRPLGVTTATIDWGDGITTAGATAVFAIDSVSSADVDSVGVDVLGEHLYSEPGTYVVRATIRAGDGTSTTVTSRVVATPALTLSGALDPASDTGASNVDGVTAHTQPHFQGSATPHAIVQLSATGAGIAAPFPIGEAVADAQGHWSITSLSLAEGTYTITATARTVDGRTRSAVTINAGQAGGPLVIDTTGPRIAGLTLDPVTSRIQANFVDNLAGLDPRGALSSTGAIFQRLVRSRATTIAVQPLLASDGGRTVVLGLGQPLRNGRYTLRVLASEVRDLAGNALDGEFNGSFVTGNGQAGGDFAVSFQVTRRRATTPRAVPVAASSEQIRRASPKFQAHPFARRAAHRGIGVVAEKA